jgi:hypothetical protein
MDELCAVSSSENFIEFTFNKIGAFHNQIVVCLIDGTMRCCAQRYKQ